MKQTSPRAMPPCFERWCSNYDDLWVNIAQKRNLRSYIVGLLGESERKNLTQLSNNMIGVSDDSLHHFITESTWKENEINERRLKVMSKCRQTKPSKKFTLIIDDSGHRKSGALTKGIGIQYIGEIGKTDNGIVMGTSHLYDGVRSLPLDVALYKHASSLPKGQDDKEFSKKPELALELIDKCDQRGHRPGIVLLDGGYGNNSSLLKKLEERKLEYCVAIAKNRNVIWSPDENKLLRKNRLDEVAVAELIKPEAFQVHYQEKKLKRYG